MVITEVPFTSRDDWFWNNRSRFLWTKTDGRHNISNTLPSWTWLSNWSISRLGLVLLDSWFTRYFSNLLYDFYPYVFSLRDFQIPNCERDLNFYTKNIQTYWESRLDIKRSNIEVQIDLPLSFSYRRPPNKPLPAQ